MSNLARKQVRAATALTARRLGFGSVIVHPHPAGPSWTWTARRFSIGQALRRDANTNIDSSSLALTNVDGNLAPLTLDTPFKRAFGTKESVNTLKHLLNAVLRGTDSSFDIAQVENVHINSSQLRSVIFDVRCKLKSGEKVTVELQKVEMREQIVDRLIGYQAHDYREQWLRGGRTEAGLDGYRLVPVRVLALLDFLVDRDRNECGSLVQHFNIQHDRTSCASQVPARALEVRFKALSDITIMQLPLAPDRIDTDSTDAAKWAHLLRYSQKYRLGELPPPLRDDPFRAAAVSACYDNMGKEERASLALEEDVLRQWGSMEESLREAERKRAEAEKKVTEAELKTEKMRIEQEQEINELKRELERMKNQ